MMEDNPVGLSPLQVIVMEGYFLWNVVVMEDNPVGLSPLQVVGVEFIWWKMIMKMNAMDLDLILKQGELVMEDNPVGLSPLKVKIGKIGKSQNLCIFTMTIYMENNPLG